MTANLRRLERLVAEGGKKVFWTDFPEGADEEPEEASAEPGLTLFDESECQDDFEEDDPTLCT